MKNMKKYELYMMIGFLLLGIVLISVGFIRQYKKQVDNDILSGDVQLVVSGDIEEEYKVQIDVKDCLPRSKIEKLIDLGEFKDNEMMVYIGNDKGHPIEVWKLKLEEGQDVVKALDMMQRRQVKIIEEYSGDIVMQETLMNQFNNYLGAGGNVVTLINSIHLEQVDEITKGWFK